jgi:hypothetical protein
MIEIIKIRYDDKGSWYSNKNRLKKILTNPLTPELFIVISDENKEKDVYLLTDLENKEILIGNEIIRVPKSDDFE